MSETIVHPRLKPTAPPCFESLVQDSINLLPAGQNVPNGPPPEFRKVVKQQKRGATVFEASFNRVGQFGDFRSVYIASPVVEIVNIFFFPEPTLPSPVFAMEFVRIGPRGVVGVIDCKAAHEDVQAGRAAASILQKAHQTYPHLINGEDPPEWYREARSGNDFFVRPDNLETFQSLVDAHHFVWSRYVEQILNSRPEVTREHARDRFVCNYKVHHRDNSPGIPFLSKVYGTDWTETFLHDHLFA